MVDHVNKSAKNLESLFWNIVFDDNIGVNNPELTTELYHYTNQKTLDECMLHSESLELRLTNLTKFSDKEEGRHILPVLKCSLKESYQAKEIDQDFFNQMTCEIDSYIQKSDDLSDWYVFCFSRNGDCEYLKKNYACRDKKTGAVLGIQTLELLETAEGRKLMNNQETGDHIPIDDLPTVLLCDVIYDPEIIKPKVRKIICKAYELYEENQENRKWLSKIVGAMVDLYKLLYKSSDFSSEEEIRLIVNGKSVQSMPNVYSFGSRFSDSTNNPQQGNEDYLYLYLSRKQALYHVWTVDPNTFTVDPDTFLL